MNKKAKLVDMAPFIENGEDRMFVDLQLNLNKKEVIELIELLNCGEIQINGVFRG